MEGCWEKKSSEAIQLPINRILINKADAIFSQTETGQKPSLDSDLGRQTRPMSVLGFCELEPYVL